MLTSAKNLSFYNTSLPDLTFKERQLAGFGKKLFHDKRFSGNGEISCASCHDPQKSFSDGIPLANALGTGNRKTPSLINQRFNHWFFWDGRSDSLEAQALEPLENPIEHGFPRSKVAEVLLSFYSKELQEHFSEQFPIYKMKPASPRKPMLTPSVRILSYTLASLTHFQTLNSILANAQSRAVPPYWELFSRTVGEENMEDWLEVWDKNWKEVSEEDQKEVNQVFARFGIAVASYVRSIIAMQSPFDAFVKRFVETHHEEKSLGEGFQHRELWGLKLFTGPGNCTLCHNSPTLSDQQFHNTGLPKSLSESTRIDLGRAVGVLAIQKNPLNCLSFSWTAESTGEKSESCKELPYLDPDNIELVGAFKTPSLRNVSERAPYGHDGRFATLADILKHYNELKEEGFIGHREESLKPLHFNDKEMQALEAFLQSLTAPVVELYREDLSKN